MEDQPSLSDAVLTAISDWFTKAGSPGIVTGFALAMERVREDGNPGITVVTPDDQSPARTLGLVGWAEEHTRDEIRYVLNADLFVGEDED